MRFLLVSLLVLMVGYLVGQNSCEICNNGIDDDENGLIDCEDAACDCTLSGDAIVIGYIPNARCNGDCGYTFDGPMMADYSRPKLANPDNFGVDGVVSCGITFVPVSTITADNIERLGCDIFFVGGFGGVACGYFTPNQISSAELAEIRKWSLRSEKNLAIVTQVNAIAWGYTPLSVPNNTNVPTAAGWDSPVFDGPFGRVEQFTQGGCYMGGFSGFPTTGHTALAVDATDDKLVTIAVDDETNDLMMGDVDMFGYLGNISYGPEMANPNDILLGNIMSLACQLISPEICGNDIDDDGDGLIDAEDPECADQSKETLVTHLCYGESIAVGGQTFTQTGSYEVLLPGASRRGCDSTVTLQLTVSEPPTEMVVEVCDGKAYAFRGEEYGVPGRYQISIERDGPFPCDSLITLVVEECSNFYIPNAFTPNGDGVNDHLRIFSSGSVRTVARFAIYDRWGGLLVHKGNLPLSEPLWDGTAGGQELDAGVYLYTGELQLAGGELKSITGSIILSR